MNPRFRSCSYVDDGQVVWAPYIVNGLNPKGTAIKCRVTVAAGNKAKVEAFSPKLSYDRWFDVCELLVEVQ